MTILTEQERVVAPILADKGYSYNEIADKFLERRTRGMQRGMEEEIAALFGRRLYPLREEDQ